MNICAVTIPPLVGVPEFTFLPSPTATTHLSISGTESYAVRLLLEIVCIKLGETSVILYCWFALGGPGTEQHHAIGSSLHLGINLWNQMLLLAPGWFTPSPLIPEGISPALTRCYAVPYGPPHKGYKNVTLSIKAWAHSAVWRPSQPQSEMKLPYSIYSTAGVL